MTDPDAPRPQARDLPARYYLTHFEEMLGAVGRGYGPILDAAQAGFLARFAALPVAARCLYVRMANRKGTAFRPETLRYREIGEPGPVLSLLHEACFVGAPEADDTDALIAALRKPELLTLLGDGAKPGWTRARLAEAARGIEAPRIAALLPDAVMQRQVAPLAYIRFLYFGRLEDSLTRFTLRDLGLVQQPERRGHYAPRFEAREEAETAYFYATRRAGLAHADADAWAREAPGWPVAVGAQAESARDALLAGLGTRLEKTDRAAARAVYDLGNSPECNERAVRLAWALDDKAGARARLDAMLADPNGEAEALFAADFMARKFGGERIADVTAMLREAPVVMLDESWRGGSEAGLCRWFAARGAQAWHSENHLWRALFGLILWERLFEAEDAALHNEFERLPATLRHGGFHDARVEAALAAIETPDGAVRAVLRTVAAHYGTPNGLFGWDEDLAPRLTAFLRASPPGAVATVLRAMAQDFRQTRDGFPDLMVIEGGRARFVEVKAEGDQLRRNQLARLSLLRRAGFDASVLRVGWFIDPDQPYVVVDVETTGGRAGAHRVTEIGAVRVRGGRVEDRWSSLINPERPIPAFITRLTGITDAMVADAPVFGEVADTFEAFMGDAIFVAHNARFDYGFITAEFARLDRRFRRPTLCTCQSARALWKGLGGYGLAPLCDHFGIELTSHHRALADAEATAELLLHINAARAGPPGAKSDAAPLSVRPVDA